MIRETFYDWWVGSVITKYLLDMQPGLAQMISATTGTNTERYIHGLRGIHAQKDATNNWEWMLQGDWTACAG